MAFIILQLPTRKVIMNLSLRLLGVTLALCCIATSASSFTGSTACGKWSATDGDWVHNLFGHGGNYVDSDRNAHNQVEDIAKARSDAQGTGCAGCTPPNSDKCTPTYAVHYGSGALIFHYIDENGEHITELNLPNFTYEVGCSPC